MYKAAVLIELLKDAVYGVLQKCSFSFGHCLAD